MRIISGKARGTKLYTLEGDKTRPTLDKVKESLFNIIQYQIQDAIFLDLFAGSGAVGLEAASRNAKKSILCENSKDAINVIKKNIEKTHLEEKTKLYEMSYETLLKNILDEKIDIAYIDPPYKTKLAYESLKLLVENNFLNNEAIVIIETDEVERIKQEIEDLKIEIYDTRKYGRAHLIFVKAK